MRAALVTGSSGFNGSSVTQELLARGYDVTGLARKTSKLNSLKDCNATLVHGDVTDRATLDAALDGISLVFHVAGCVTTLENRECYRINEQGTRNLLEAASARSQPPAAVVVSLLSASPRPTFTVS
ncbi:MAG TPA: NAD-dependent epimerase/dehydratase family protein [Pirellulales bacterium]|jgi:dihydroflavonol-4-reductase|nr:NAD-dependent epimerase/dehydratase family protein [Pirellulales bacterium]